MDKPDLNLISQGWRQLITMLQCLPQDFAAFALTEPCGIAFFETLFDISQRDEQGFLDEPCVWKSALFRAHNALIELQSSTVSVGFSEELGLFRAGLELLQEKIGVQQRHHEIENLRMSSLAPASEQQQTQLRVIPAASVVQEIEPAPIAERPTEEPPKRRIQLKRTVDIPQDPVEAAPEQQEHFALQQIKLESDSTDPKPRRIDVPAAQRTIRKIVLTRNTSTEAPKEQFEAPQENTQSELQRLRIENKKLRDTIAELQARMKLYEEQAQ